MKKIILDLNNHKISAKGFLKITESLKEMVELEVLEIVNVNLQ
jgi:hypothetical protein